ncbi:MAG: carboxypeptidase regulatory-like domain-containing protein, partial [Chloroflexi bacterium]|nr:carboxypeptidase regulatory-like domain-containing protein [Chloroflexota bacterium]
GVVVDYATGAPLAGATVEQVGEPRRVRTAADGSFLLLLPAGPQRVVARAPGYLAEEETQAPVPPGATSERIFALLPERPDAQMEAQIVERWQRGERGAPLTQAAGGGPGRTPAVLTALLASQQTAEGPAGEPTLGLRASALGPSFRALLPALQRGCGPPTAPAGATLTIRVLLPNGCVVALDL